MESVPLIINRFQFVMAIDMTCYENPWCHGECTMTSDISAENEEYQTCRESNMACWIIRYLVHHQLGSQIRKLLVGKTGS